MNNFLISFELRKDHSDRYDDVYECVHRNGGYRYVRMQNDLCGTLPGTCVMYRSKRRDQPSALMEFVDCAGKDLGVRICNICVLQGSPTAMSGYCPTPAWFKRTDAEDEASTIIHGYAENLAQSPYQNMGNNAINTNGPRKLALYRPLPRQIRNSSFATR